MSDTRRPFAVVAIPTYDEADRIGSCLSALAMQRDLFGAPLVNPAFEVLVFAIGCTDETASVVATLAVESLFPIVLVDERLPPENAKARGARRRAMDLAANRLTMAGSLNGVILTSDADSIVASTCVAATLRAFETGVDAVAGYIDAHPMEMMRCGGAFLRRGRLEKACQRFMAEIDALAHAAA